MKHTQAKRGSDGRFGGTDGPKAKRVEVWLQPQTVELLDTLCKQWSVGRGKVIDQLLTRGPVPPAAWTAVEVEATPSPEPEPTPSAPKPKPTKRQKLQQQADHINQQPIPDAKFADGDRVVDNRGRSFAVLSAQWHKAGVSASRDVVLNAHWQYRCKPEKGSESYLTEDLLKPEPTTSGPRWLEEYQEMTSKHAAEWQSLSAEAKRLNLNPQLFQHHLFKLKIPRNYPISPEAEQEVRDSIENEQRAEKGEAKAIGDRIKRLRERATPERLAAMAQAMKNDDVYIIERIARDYLSSGLEAIGLKPQRKVSKKLIATLEELLPSAADYMLETRFNDQKAVLWGAILRLGNLEGEPPTSSRREFLEWCRYDIIKSHSTTVDADRSSDLFSKQMSIAEARSVLGLPQGVELTRKAITNAYIPLAKKHHPDVGGDHIKIQGINEARERLLKTVNN